MIWHSIAEEIKCFVRWMDRVPDRRELFVIANIFGVSKYYTVKFFEAMDALARKRYYEKKLNLF
jgi:hypothetical protein